MGTSNLGTDNEVQRRMHAREVLVHMLPNSRDNSPGRGGRGRRGGGTRTSATPGGNLALSGHTTTSKGHIIHPPGKARLIAFEYGQVSDERPVSASHEENIPGEDEFNKTYDSVRKSSTEDQKTAGKATQSSLVSAFCKSVDDETCNDDRGSEHNGSTNNNTGTMSFSRMFGKRDQDISNDNYNNTHHQFQASKSPLVDTTSDSRVRTDSSSAGRDSRTERNHRSHSPSITGNVTGSRNEVSSKIAAIREEYAVRKRNREDMNANHGQYNNNDATARNEGANKVDKNANSQQKPGRRRRDRQINIQASRSSERSETHAKQLSGLARKSGPSLNALGNSNNNVRNKSPYLPAYIQPVIDESTSYRQSNHVVYQRNASSIVSQRNRKISTEMNRYDSSTSSSSSSSSDSENLSPVRSPVHKNIRDNLPRSRLQSETPDNSEGEKRRPEIRRRRSRRSRLTNDNKARDLATTQQPRLTGGEKTARSGGRIRADDGIRERNRRHNDVIPMLDDKYVTLPDNYKQSEFVPTSAPAEDSAAQTHKFRSIAAKAAVGGTTESHGSVNARQYSAESLRSAGGRSEEIPETTTPSIARKHERHNKENSSNSNAEKLIINGVPKASHRTEKGERSVGQTSPPAGISHQEDQLGSDSGISKHVDLSVSSPDLNATRQSVANAPLGSSKTADQQSNSLGRTRRNSNSSEAKVLRNIRSVFENKEAPKGGFGQSYLKKEQSSQGSNRLTKANIHDNFDNGVVQSQPKIKARKVSEDFWPRDEATERLLSRKTSSASLSPPANKEYDKISLTMQETIDQLHKFADDDIPVYKSKSRSNSSVGISEVTKNNELDRPPNTDAAQQQSENQKSSHYVRKGSNSRPGLINLSKVQMVKVTPLDMSPCMSSTETLKEYSSSGEYQGRNSRSHSIDSIASNPEAIVKNNATMVKERNLQVNREVAYNQVQGNLQSPEKSDLFIVEGHENSEDTSNIQQEKKSELTDSRFQSNSGDLTNCGNKLPQKSMVMQMKELTASLRKFKLAGPAQPLNSPANWQKATSRTDPILSVSPRGNVTCLPPNLETLSEHPEPSSPVMTKKSYKKTPGYPLITDSIRSSGSKSMYASSKSTITDKNDESVDIDEGIVTEEELIEDPHSYLKLDERLDELNKRRKRGSQTSSTKDSDVSNGNDSARSLSDPMANRKRSTPGEKSIDSNLLGSLQTAKTATMTLFDQQSASSLSVYSEQISSYGDSTNADDFSYSLDEVEYKSQKVGKKKSFSDPNPEGVISHGFHEGAEVIQENEFQVVHSASSEPNVTEQTDKLGDLDQFKIYQTSKVLSENVFRAQDWTGNKGILHEEENPNAIFPEDPAFVSQRNVRRNISMKAKLRAKNEAMKGENSMVSQLLALQDSSPKYSPDQQYLEKESANHSSSTSSPGASAETSPVRKQGPETLLESEQQFFRMYDSMKSRDAEALRQMKVPVHSRSSSEPADMKSTDIDALEDFQQVQNSFNRGRRAGITQAPSLDNVGNRYSTAETANLDSDINSPATFSPSKHSQSMDGVFPTSLPSKRENYPFIGSQEKGKVEHDMRLHAFKNLLETEESYVSSLRILYQDYMTPLKHPENHSTCEPRLVDEMFQQIPQLYQHHEKFYENVQKCYSDWDYKDVQLGDLFLKSFNKDALLETYTSYIKNYLNAREAVRTAKAKTAFRLFIERCQLENKEKQGLGDLMIKPVQRIPRYELIIKDLLKHTPESHQDRAGLLIAQREIHTLAVQMNHSEKEAEAAEKHDRLLADIEQIIEGCVDLCVPKRRFLRQDIIAELKGGNKKDRSLWLFNDLIVCTTAKKGRTGSFRRSSMNLWSLGQERLSIDFTNKYKFLWKFPLEDVEHLKGNIGLARNNVDKQLQTLQNDLEIITNMNKLSIEIACNHVQLDEALKEILSYVSRQIADKKHFQSSCPPGRIELGISTGDGVKTFMFEFFNEDIKVQFERLFANAKRSLTTQKNRWEPTFMKAIPISKTRAGMQFSCAAPNLDSADVREVWVCNTDGYVGQVCFLSLEPEPAQTQCITVCNAKICCIGQVPTWERRMVPASTLLQEISKGPLAHPPPTNRRHSSSTSNPALAIMSWDDQDDSDEDNTSPISTMSSYSSYSVSPYSTNNSTSNYDNLQAADLVSLPGFVGSKICGSMDQSGHRSREGVAWKKDSDGSTLHGSLEDLLADGEALSGAAQGILAGKDSMWLGTEDGKIHIYPSSENIRGSKHCIKLRHSAAVHCILYHDGQVFVALSNGDLVIYFRNLTTGEWDFENQKTKSKVSSPHAITKMVIVGQKDLWCGCQNQIKIIDTKEHTEIDHFSVTTDNKRQIFCMACCNFGVWVALDKRPQIKLFHTAFPHNLLADIDVSSPVSKMLASADAIIRQHKAACLRITSLLVCKDLLWVGTSAGVVLTLTLPKISEHTSSLPLPLMPQGLAYGHTGHVRFLTAAEVPDKEQNSLSRGGSRRASTNANKRRMSSSSSAANQPRTISVIISGGDGYEDFRMNSASESAGREDSTNHLLVWRA